MEQVPKPGSRLRFQMHVKFHVFVECKKIYNILSIFLHPVQIQHLTCISSFSRERVIGTYYVGFASNS